jgi:hypothetical protein
MVRIVDSQITGAYSIIEKQTVEYNIRIREHFKNTVRSRMSVWEAMEKLNQLIDDSDPDVGVYGILCSSDILTPPFLDFRLANRTSSPDSRSHPS